MCLKTKPLNPLGLRVFCLVATSISWNCCGEQAAAAGALLRVALCTRGKNSDSSQPQGRAWEKQWVRNEQQGEQVSPEGGTVGTSPQGLPQLWPKQLFRIKSNVQNK